MGIGAFTCFGTDSCGILEAFPGIRPTLAVLSGLFRIPFFRDYLMSLGIYNAFSKMAEVSLSDKQFIWGQIWLEADSGTGPLGYWCTMQLQYLIFIFIFKHMFQRKSKNIVYFVRLLSWSNQTWFEFYNWAFYSIFLFKLVLPWNRTTVSSWSKLMLPSYFFWSGLCAVSKQSLAHLLTKSGKGNAVAIVIGGAAESLASTPGINTVLVKRRKGFVRVALEFGWAH